VARETPFIESALAGQPAITAHRVPGDDVLDFDVFADPPEHEEPFAGLRGLARDRAMVRCAADAGATTLLTGVGADDLTDVLPFHIADLLRRGKIRQAWREACRWAKAMNSGTWAIFHRFGLANLLPAGWRGGLSSLLRGGAAGPKNLGEGTVAPWIPPGFARTHTLRACGVEYLRRQYGACRPLALSLALTSVRALSGDGPRWYLAEPHNLMIAHPFLDRRIVTLSLGIQSVFRQDPGRQKPILTEALKNVLPEKILTRRQKGHYNEAYFTGLARNRESIEKMIEQSPAGEMGLLDKATLVDHLRQAALGVEHCAGGAVRLDLTLALLRWLSREAEWRKQPTAPPCRVESAPLGEDCENNPGVSESMS
jgi:asparagine synthase (glutamine-hydrolysing)